MHLFCNSYRPGTARPKMQQVLSKLIDILLSYDVIKVKTSTVNNFETKPLYGGQFVANDSA